MKMIKAATLLLFFTVTSLYAQEKYISICSFNIAELGAHRENKDHGAIARMISEFDLIVVEEVMDNGGEDHINIIVDSLNAHASETYSFVMIPSAGRGYPGNEGYAYIYRQPVELDTVNYETVYGLKTTEVDYGRTPGWAYFRAGNFDFMAVAIHLHWSNTDTRELEVADLLSWMEEWAARPASEERDLILVGDFNRFGNYSNTAINNQETAYHIFLNDSDLNTNYRLPFCEYLPEMNTKEAPSDEGSTSVSDNNNMIYDQIIINAGLFNEFGEEQGALGENIGIVLFDNWTAYSGLDLDTIKDQVSDHRPVYARFRYDFPDDDGVKRVSCDFNGDGNINIADVISLLLYQRSNPGDLAADFNGDGSANISDAIAMLLAQRNGECPNSN